MPQSFAGPGTQNSGSGAVPRLASPQQAAEALENYLRQLADEILLSAGADGVAIALVESAELRCRASRGTAPLQGALIDARSGLTGACLSTGTVLRCDDTEQDLRVDQQVCRALGIRSIVCVPVRAGQETVGIFEIFSSRRGAFDEIDIDGLRSIAGEIAQCFEAEEALTRAAVAGVSDLGATGELPPAWIPVSVPAHARRPMNPVTLRKLRNLLGALVLLLGLFLVVRAIRASHAPLAQTAPPLAADSMVSGQQGRPSQPEKRRSSIRASRTASVDSEDTVSAHSEPLAIAGGGTQALGNESLPTPPALVSSIHSASDPLRQLVGSVTAAQPVLPSHAGSNGIPEPVLLRRVTPIYPELARQHRIEGDVVVDATVDAQGKVSQARVESGNELLAGAALRAVRQWRYQPYLFDGKPIAVPVKITLKFELSQ
jgi:TonB family protein